MAKIQWSKTFSFALKEGFSLKRILPFFLINLILLGGMIYLFNSIFSAIAQGIVSGSSAAILSIFSVMIVFFALIFVILLLKVLVEGIITDDAKNKWDKNKTNLKKSFKMAKSKYWSLFGASLLVALIAGVVTNILAFIPIIGGFLSMLASIILAMMFLFIAQFIVISNSKAVESLQKGYYLFMKNKWDVLLFWIVLTIISFLILLVALIPIIIAAVPLIMTFFTIITTGSTTDILTLITTLQESIPYLIAGAVVTMFILAYEQVFEVNARVAFFLQKTKKR